MAGSLVLLLGVVVAAALSSANVAPTKQALPVASDPFNGPPPVADEKTLAKSDRVPSRPAGLSDDDLFADLDQLKATASVATRSYAPNGRPWPSQAAYVPGYKRMNSKGLSKVTIDNSQVRSPAYVKLVDLKSGERVRHVFIPANGKFTIANVSPGNYDVRYKDLDANQISRTESFLLQQINDDRGTTYSNVTLTLYKVRDGNMTSQPIQEANF
jgi:hypothetical protein